MHLSFTSNFKVLDGIIKGFAADVPSCNSFVPGNPNTEEVSTVFQKTLATPPLSLKALKESLMNGLRVIV